jgi:MFS transporter, PPP family, 3-phenylpropionic acid transporter
MKKTIDVYEHMGEILKGVKSGVLITGKADDKVNSMTISWGMIGIEWGKPIFVTFIRENRFTRSLIEKTGEFTVSIPIDDSAKKILGFCGVTLLQLLTPFINSLGMESINQGHNLNFGIARGMGSVAYAALSYVLGIITSRTGITAVPVCIMIVTLVLMGCLALFPFTKSSSVPTGDNSKKQTSNPLQFLRKYKRFTIVLVGCILIYLGHVLLNSFTFQIVQSKGGGSSEMGTATAIAAMSELPTLFLFGYMLKKARCDIWFRLTGIFFTLKSLGSLLAPNMTVFYGIQIFQMLGWGLMAAASVYYVNSIMDAEDAIKGQAYITMTYTLGSVIGAFLGGALIDFSGVNTMLLFATISAAVGAVIIFFSAEKTA